MCIAKLRRQAPAATEQVLMKRRWGCSTSNMRAVVAGEANCAMERLSRPPEVFERFLAYEDALGRRVDEDCANYAR
eukprot:12860536-Alexandrium_andersonii.AAC.1